MMATETMKPASSVPLEKHYWRLVRFLMCSVALWPRQAVGEPRSRLADSYHIYTVLQTMMFTTAQIHYIWKNFNAISFFKLGHMIITVFTLIATAAKQWLPFDRRYGRTANIYFTTFHLGNFKSKDHFSAKVAQKIDTISKYFAYYYSAINFTAVAMLSVTPVVTNYMNGAFEANRSEELKLEVALYFTVPLVDYTSNIRDWIVTSIYTIYMLYETAFSYSIPDLYFFLVVFQIMGRIVILENNFTSMKPPASRRITRTGEMENEDRYSKEENLQIREELIGYLHDHNQIVKFVKDLGGCFGNVLLFSYIFHTVCGCILLLELMQGPQSYIRYGPLAVVQFSQLIVLSLILEHVGTLSNKLSDALYNSPWPCMDVSNQKMVLLILLRIQHPIQFNAKGLVNIGVKPMMGILKSTFSYFMFLKQKN